MQKGLISNAKLLTCLRSLDDCTINLKQLIKREVGTYCKLYYYRKFNIKVLVGDSQKSESRAALN